MTKRRRITIRTEAGKRTSEVVARAEQLRRMVFDQFGGTVPVEKIEAFIDAMNEQGFTQSHIQSMAKQWQGGSQEALPAALHHNQHTLDILMRNQAAWTHFRDTADQPNFALRMPAEAELLLRRVSLGDSILMKAAHRASATYGHDERPSSQNETYWRELWVAVTTDLCGPAATGSRNMHEQSENPFIAAATALSFALSRDPDMTSGQIVEMFCVEGRPFYCGVKARHERARLRGTETYKPCWVFHYFEEIENLWEVAVNAILWAIDHEYLRAHTEGFTRYSPADAFDRYINLTADHSAAYVNAVEDGEYNEADPRNWELETEHRPPVPEHTRIAVRQLGGSVDQLTWGVDVCAPAPIQYHEQPEPQDADQQEEDTPASTTIDPRRLLP